MRENLLSFFEPPVSSDPVHNVAKLAWIVRLRWIALIAQLATIPFALDFGLLEHRLLPVYLGVIAALAALNVFTRATLPRRREVHAAGLLIQLGADIAALSGLLALTGGAWNPLVPILFVHAGLGALMLEGRQGVFFFGLLIGCLVLLQLFPNVPPELQGSLLPPVILFPAQLVVALVFWILTAWLSRTLGALQAQAALTRERQTRIDRLRAVGALAAGLSHELATPLNTAQLKVARLGRRPELAQDADVATAAEALQRCGDVLRHMAGGTLSPEGLDLEVTEVDALLQRVCASVAQLPEGSRVRFRSEGSSSSRALLPALAFSQAILNLIDNAVESGGPDQEVDVRVATRPGYIDVRVLDRGPGWPDVVRAHLGQPFVTTKADGVGLGLYYVHTLAEAVGAEFQMEDRESGGAIARITLPALPVLAAADGAEVAR